MRACDPLKLLAVVKGKKPYPATIDKDKKKKKKKKVSFDESLNEQFEVLAYSDMFIKHPRRMVSTSNGFMIVPSKSDPFTGMGAEVMNARRARHHFSDRDRVQRHRKGILDGFRSNSYSAIVASVSHSSCGLTDDDVTLIARCFARCGTQSDETQRIHAARTPSAKKKGPNRQGAKAVKKLERASGTGDLNPTEATLFRALSARANDLAQDRPDVAFPTKE